MTAGGLLQPTYLKISLFDFFKVAKKCLTLKRFI